MLTRPYRDAVIANSDPPSLVVFTDLDGTLLDHDTYTWQPAEPALRRLDASGVPVVLISSKTLSEIAHYRAELGLRHPVVAENGAVIDVPDHYFCGSIDTIAITTDRATLQKALTHVRRELAVQCTAFFELGASGIARTTGLSIAQATRANERRATEPLLWQDSDDALRRFSDAMSERGLHCVRGGRFVHLMARTDKADAMQRLLAVWRRKQPVKSVALGDGPNDLQMLRAADIAVVIPGAHGLPMPLERHPRVLRPTSRGPVGWNEAILSILDTEISDVG